MLSKKRETLKLAASKNELLCVEKKEKKQKKKRKKEKKPKQTEKNLSISSENQRGYLTDFSICNFNRVDDTKDTKDFFLCAVCILLVLSLITPTVLSYTQKRPAEPRFPKKRFPGSCQFW